MTETSLTTTVALGADPAVHAFLQRGPEEDDVA